VTITNIDVGLMIEMNPPHLITVVCDKEMMLCDHLIDYMIVYLLCTVHSDSSEEHGVAMPRVFAI
jgi:hypothetical protein